MAKEILQITIEEHKEPKSKLGKWFYWKIWYKIWYIYRVRLKSWFYGGVSNMMLKMMPEAKREELLKELFDKDSPIVKMLKDDEENAPQMMQATNFLDDIEQKYGVDDEDLDDLEDTGILDLLIKK